MKPETRSKSMALIREYFDHVPLKVSFKEEIKSYQFWKSVRTEFLATLLFVTIGCGICIVSNYDTIHSDCGQVEREVGREVERKFAENFRHFDSGEGPSGVQLTGKQALGRQQTSNQSLVHDGQIGLQTEQENVGQENVGQGNVGQENAGASLQNVDMGPHSGSRGKRQVAVQHLVDSSGTNEPKGFTPSSSSGFSSSIPDSSASSHVSTPSSSTDSTFRVHLDNKNQHLGSSLSEGGEEDILHVPTSQPTSPLLYLHEQAWIESSFSPSAIKSNLLKQTNHGGTSSPNYNNRGKSGSIMIDSNQHGPNSGRTRGKSSEGSGKSSEGPGQRECNKPDEMYHLKNGLGFALLTTLLMIITSNQIHGYTNCHLNPCLTLASFITRDTSLLKLILFVIVQSIASILGSVVLFGLTSYKRDAGTSQEPIHHHDVHGRYLGSTQLTVEDNTFNSIHPSFHTENIPVPNLFGFEFIATFLIVLTYFSVTEKLHDSSRSRLGDGSSRNGPIHRTIIIPFEGKDFRCHCRQGRDVNETQPEEERKKNQTREERTGGEDNDLCTNICTRCCRSCCHLLEGGQKLCGRSEEEGEIDVARFGKRRNEMDRKEGNAIIIKEWTQASPSSSSSSSTGFFVVGISLLTCHLFVVSFVTVSSFLFPTINPQIDPRIFMVMKISIRKYFSITFLPLLERGLKGRFQTLEDCHIDFCWENSRRLLLEKFPYTFARKIPVDFYRVLSLPLGS